MKNIIYPSRIKDTNLGDVLINTLLIRELSKFGKVYVDGNLSLLYDLVTLNNEFESNIIIVKGIEKFEGKPIFRWINLIFILKTISLVFDPPGAYSEVKNPYKAKFKFLKYYSRAIILKTLFNIQVVRYGISLGPFSPQGYNSQRKLSTVYKNIGIRDSKNYTDLINRGFNNLSLTEDLAYLYNSSDFNLLLSNEIVDGIKSPYIVISFRSDIEGNGINVDYINAITDTIHLFIDHNQLSSYLFVFSYQVSEDLVAINSIKKSFDKLGLKTSIIESQLSFSQAITLYHNAYLVLSNRLHVALLALLNDTLPIVITDNMMHEKIVNVFKDINMDDLLIDINRKKVDQFSIINYNNYIKEINIRKKNKANTIRENLSYLFH